MKEIRDKKKWTIGIVMISVFVYFGLGFEFALLLVGNKREAAELAGFMVLIVAILILILVLSEWKHYRTHWLMYGDGKIIVRRITGKYLNTYGGMETDCISREDEVLLEELAAYGFSNQFMNGKTKGADVQGGNYNFYMELFFELKNGKKIWYNACGCRDKDMRDLQQYIYDETGLKALRIEDPDIRYEWWHYGFSCGRGGHRPRPRS